MADYQVTSSKYQLLILLNIRQLHQLPYSSNIFIPDTSYSNLTAVTRRATSVLQLCTILQSSSPASRCTRTKIAPTCELYYWTCPCQTKSVPYERPECTSHRQSSSLDSAMTAFTQLQSTLVFLALREVSMAWQS